MIARRDVGERVSRECKCVEWGCGVKQGKTGMKICKTFRGSEDSETWDMDVDV